MSITNQIEKTKAFFNSKATLSIEFRIEQLKKLKNTIVHYQSQIESALWADLRKSPEECYLTEIFVTLQEINLHIKHLKSWAKLKYVPTPLHLFPSESYLHYEPLGVALIFAPWNYPFNLVFNPLIGAISAGCCAVVKPSPEASATAGIVCKIIEECFCSDYICTIQGETETSTQLLEQKFDIIFFTGSPRVGKIVYEAAAKNLTPVILELGGKSPCIVDLDADIAIAARRITFGKWLNAGQTCIAPDYLFVHNDVKDELLKAIKVEIVKMYGDDIINSPYYGRLINHKRFDCVKSLYQGQQLYFGGESDRDAKYISPTIVDNVATSSPIMQEEIFGPLLPVITFDTLDVVIEYVNSNEKPLALYYFGGGSKRIINQTSSGGVCINDTIMHIANHNLPFGGVGNSGVGRYHGKDSFRLFSNSKSVLNTPTWIDLPFRYAPYKFINIIKRFFA